MKKLLSTVIIFFIIGISLFYSGFLSNGKKNEQNAVEHILLKEEKPKAKEYITYEYKLKRINPTRYARSLIIDEKRYSYANDYLDYFMNFDYVKNDTEAQEIYAQIQKKRSEIFYNIGKCLAGFATGDGEENISKSCGSVAIVSDVRDIGIESWNYVSSNETDGKLLGLSASNVSIEISQLFIPEERVGFFITNIFSKFSLKNKSYLKNTVEVASEKILYGNSKSRTSFKNAYKQFSKNPLAQKCIEDYAERYKNGITKKDLIEVNNICEDKFKSLYINYGNDKLLLDMANNNSSDEIERFVNIFKGSSYVVYRIAGDGVVKASQNVNTDDDLRALAIAVTYGEKGIAALQDIGTDEFQKHVSDDTKADEEVTLIIRKPAQD